MVEILDLDYLSAFSPLAEGVPVGRGGGNCSMSLIYCCSFMLSALKGLHLLAQGKRPQGATPWVCCVLIYRRPERAKALQQGMNSIQYIKMLLPFPGANTIRLTLPRVSLPMVACPGLCAFGPSGRSYPGCRLTLFALPWAGRCCPFRARERG